MWQFFMGCSWLTYVYKIVQHCWKKFTPHFFSNVGNYLEWAYLGLIEKSKQLDAKILTERKYLAESFLLFGTQLIPNHSVLRSNVPIKRIGHV